MPSITLSAAENLLKTFNPNMQRSSYKKLAKAGLKRVDAIEQAKAREGVLLTEQECLEVFRTIVYGDPVGDEAVAHVMDPDECTHHESVALRLSLVAA